MRRYLRGSATIKPDLSDAVAAAWTKGAMPETSNTRNLMLGGAAAVLAVALHEKPAVSAQVTEVAAEGVELVGKTAKELFSPKAWDVAKGVKKLAGELIERRPQVDSAGQLQNYFVGSVGTTLLAKAGRFTEISSNSLPEIVREKTVELNSTALSHLTSMVRKIGDVDVVDLPGAQNRFADGLGLFMHRDLPKSAAKAFDESSEYLQVRAETHPYLRGIDQVVAVPLGDKEVFVAHPSHSGEL